MPSPLIEISQFSYGYPRSSGPVLRDLSLTIQPGEIVALMGPTGAGKTTLCLALAGLVPQFYRGRCFGSIQVAGHDTLDTPIHTLSRHVGLVLQDPGLQLVTTSVTDEVAFALENFGLPVAEIKSRVAEALATVGLAEFATKHPQDLSGGQQQRLVIATVLAARPPVIVLDEPTSQLDPVGTAEIFALVTKLNVTLGTTFVITSQASEELAITCTRAVLIDQGQLIVDGPIEAVLADVDLMARHHLRPPQITSVFAALNGAAILPVATPLPVTMSQAEMLRPQLPPAHAFAPRPSEPVHRGIPILQLIDVTHRYPDGTEALTRLTLPFHRGDYCLIIGQNGAGKSTLLQHLLNLLQPTSGDVLIDGVPLASFSVAALAQRIGFVPQRPDQNLFNATVEAEVGFSLQTISLTSAQKHRRCESALEAMRLTHLRKAHPFSLSQADRARVVIAAMLVLEPEVLIFDEPTTGQDEEGARAILDLTRELHAQGRTIIVVSHHLYLMPDYADRVVVMGRGRLLFDAPLREAFHATTILAQTSVRPPQAAVFAQQLHPANRAVTPSEIIQSFLPAPSSA